jgi:hypothetical protein
MPACNTPTATGPCSYPADRCPLHTTPPAPEPDASTAKPAPDVNTMLAEIHAAITAGDADPVHVARMVVAIERIAELTSELTDEEKADEAFLRGKILNGVPPETEHEWNVARCIFDDEALLELASWPMCLPGSFFPDWVDAMRDPNDPKFAWRYMDRHGPWNNGNVKRRVVHQHVTRGWTDNNPYEGGEPSARDAEGVERDRYGADRDDRFSKRPWDECVELIRQDQAERRAAGYTFTENGVVWRAPAPEPQAEPDA